MRLALGPRSFDITTRALVVAVLGEVAGDDLLERAERSCSQRADILELRVDEDAAVASTVGSLISGFDVPVCVTTDCPGALAAAIAAGAAMVRPGAGYPGAPLLAVAVEAGTTLALSAAAGGDDLGPCADLVALARCCEEAGVPSSHIVLDAGSAPRARARIVALGYPVMAGAPANPSATDPSAMVPASAAMADIALADIALAVIGGCRLVRTVDVRQARRVIDVVAAILEAP